MVGCYAIASKKAWDVLKLGTKKRFGAREPGGEEVRVGTNGIYITRQESYGIQDIDAWIGSIASLVALRFEGGSPWFFSLISSFRKNDTAHLPTLVTCPI